MSLKGKLTKWRGDPKPGEKSAPPQTLPSAGSENPASTSHSFPLPTSTTTWRSKITPRFLLRSREDSPANQRNELGPKPSVPPSTALHTATNIAVLEKGERETLSPPQFQPPAVNQNAPSPRKEPISTFMTPKPVAATQPKKILAQYARHDEKGAVGAVSTPASHTPYPIRQYVGGKKVLAQYGHPDNKGAAKRY